MHFKTTVLCCAAALLLTATIPAKYAFAEVPLENRLELFCKRIDERRQELHIPGLALAVVKNDKVVLSRGFGFADVENERPVTPETLFAVGSTTKAFTATAIGMLVDEGKMQWDDPVVKHLPYYDVPVDDNDQAVTIRDLLCHRSGFTRMGILWAAGNTTRQEILETAATAKRWSPFRKKFNYCNVTYMAAGEAAGAASGLGWETLVDQRILKPLGMQDSNMTIAEFKANEDHSLGYKWTEDSSEFEALPMRDLSAVAPAGAINSNSIDMAQWVRFQLARGEFEGKRLISDQQLDETWSRQISMGPEGGYGLGWMLREIDGKRVIEHGGSIDGHAAQVGLFPDDGVGFILLSNVTHSPLQQLSLQIFADTMFGNIDEVEEAVVENENLQPFVGRYVANFGPFRDVHFTVQVENNKLAVDVPGQMLYELKPPGEDGKRYFAITDQVAVSFQQDDTGKATSMTLYQAGMEFTLPREDLSPKQEDEPGENKKYVGSYQFDDKRTARVFESGDQLALELPGKGVIPLRSPNDDGEWEFVGAPNRAVKFETEGDQVTAMTYVRRQGESKRLPRVDGGTESELPTVEEVLALRKSDQRHQVFENLDSLKIVGDLRFQHAGVSATSTVVWAKGNRLHTDLDCGRFGRTVRSIHGETGWVESNIEVSRKLSAQEIAETSLESPPVLFGDWRDSFDEIVVKETRKVNGREMIKLHLLREDLEPVTVLIDAETGDLFRSSYQIKTVLGTLAIRTEYSDHREMHGLRSPWFSTTRNEHFGQLDAQTTEMIANVDPSPELFSVPVSE